MSKRCVVNVACGFWYPRGQARLLTSVWEHNPGLDTVAWCDKYPPFSPSHQEMPFAFKSHALRAALDRGYTTLLWADASCWAVRSLDPLFEAVESQGYVFINNGWKIGQWASDHALNVFGLNRDEAMEKKEPTVMMFGLDLTNSMTQRWFADWCERCKDPKLMNGSLHNKPGQEIIDPHSGVNVGVISSDPRCRGHSREQVTAGLCAYRHGLTNFTDGPQWLHVAPPSVAPDPRAVFQACGM